MNGYGSYYRMPVKAAAGCGCSGMGNADFPLESPQVMSVSPEMLRLFSQSQQVPPPPDGRPSDGYAPDAGDRSMPGQEQGWWAQQDNTTKAALIIGGVAVLGAGIYLAM